jgi:periplasmic protein TonB
MMVSKKKILLGVFLAQFLVLIIFILISSLSSRQDYSSPVTSVDLVTEISVAPEMEEEAPPEEPPPPPEEPEPEPIPEPETEPIPKEETKPVPKKIIKRIKPIKLPESNLKKRLQERLSKVKTTSPARPATRTRISTGNQKQFPYSWYTDIIRSKMYNLWKRPTKEAVNKETATVIVSFRVFRDGHIENIRLKESSGSKVVDESALQAARAADPLPPLPDGFKGRYEDFVILFELTD